MNNKLRQKQAGFNLIEVLIAALVLSVGLLGLAGLQVSSLKAAQNAVGKQHGTVIINELLERMRGNRVGVANGDYVKVVQCSDNPPSTDCTQGQCTSQQWAGYDLYSVLCGRGGADDLAARLMNSRLTITCPSGGNCGKGLQVGLSWVERVTQSGITGTPGQTGTQQGANGELNTETFSLQLNAII